VGANTHRATSRPFACSSHRPAVSCLERFATASSGTRDTSYCGCHREAGIRFVECAMPVEEQKRSRPRAAASRFDEACRLISEFPASDPQPPAIAHATWRYL